MSEKLPEYDSETPDHYIDVPEAISHQAVYKEFGPTIDVSKKELKKLFNTAERYYEKLPYHNFRHAQETLWVSLSIAAEYQQNGGELNTRALVAAALFHDADFSANPKEVAAGSKEEHSAIIFHGLRQELGYSEEEAFEVGELIMVTKRGADPTCDEDVIMVLADLHNVYGHYDEFIASTRALRAEGRILKNGILSDVNFVLGSAELLHTYFRKNLTLEYFETEAMRSQGLHNIGQLGLEPLRCVGEFALTKMGSAKDQAAS